MGNPDVVLKAGSSILPKSSARASRTGSAETAYADKAPPRYLMTVSKNGAYELLNLLQHQDHMWIDGDHTFSNAKVDFETSSKDSWNKS
jgi:hypothetical protein